MTTLKQNAEGLIPVELSKDIVQAVANQSAVMKLSRIEPMKTSEKVISVSNGSKAYWVGEGQTIGNEDTGFRPVTLRTQKLGIIHVFSSELINESIVNVFETIKKDIVSEFQLAFDTEAINGTNKKFEKSILGVASAAGNEVVGTLNLGDISDVMALVEDTGMDVNGFIGHNGLKNQLRKLRDDNGFPLYQAVKEGAGNLLYGEPVTFTKGVNKATTDLITGDFQHSVVGIKGDIEYKLLDQATVGGISLAENDLVAIRAIMHVAYAVTNDDAFATIKNA